MILWPVFHVLGLVVYIRFMEVIHCIYRAHGKAINGAQKLSIGFKKGSWFCRKFI